jgi:HAD superfamily hydrolase (TIGR01509 family)
VTCLIATGLKDHAKIAETLQPERIGVELSEDFPLHPEQSTDAALPAPVVLPASAVPAPAVLPAGVLWDMDGTLVDTEPYWIEEEFALVAEHGGSWSEADAHSLVGNDLIVSANYIRDVGGVALAPEEIVDRLLERVIARIRVHIPWRPGARELLAELNAHDVPCAMVTMSYQNLAQAVVEMLPAGSFRTVVAGDDVEHGKPHPEPYLVAAARLGLEPERCVAIEDSLTGVASAEAAKVPVLAVEHLVPIPPGPGRTVVTSLQGWTAAGLAALS